MSQRETGGRPDPSEYAPFYETYVSKVPEDDVLGVLSEQLLSTGALLDAIPEPKHGHRYAEGKWSTREVVGHVLDTERVFAYRALRFARGDATPLPGMDQDQFMQLAHFESRTMPGLAAEYRDLRGANLALFESLDGAALDRRGVASDCPFSVRALLFIVAGHERHHIAVLRERYL